VWRERARERKRGQDIQDLSLCLARCLANISKIPLSRARALSLSFSLLLSLALSLSLWRERESEANISKISLCV